MTSPDHDPHTAPISVPHVNPPHRATHLSFWIRELPFTMVLVLTIAGVAYTSFSKQPIVGLLGNSRADYRAGLRRCGLAGGGG